MSAIRELFEENGYYHARGVYSPDEVETMEAEFDRIVVQIKAAEESVDATWRGASIKKIKARDDVVVHTHNVHRFSAAWLQAVLHRRLLGVVEEIIGKDIVLHHTKLFFKPPEKGSPFPMHQDWTYFPTIRDTMMAGIIHVSEATDAMGCVRVYPGAHKLGRVPNSGGQTADEMELQRRYPIEEATVLEAEPGDVVFFHYFMLHGSMPNRSKRSRKTVLVQMYSGADRVEDGIGHPDERLALRGWNHHMTRSAAIKNDTLDAASG